MSDDLLKRLRDANTNHIDADLWMAEAAARIEELEAQIKNDALQYLSDTGQMGEAVGDLTRRHQHALHKIDVLEDEIDELKAKLATAVEALSYYANHDILLLYDDASFAKDTIATIK